MFKSSEMNFLHGALLLPDLNRFKSQFKTKINSKIEGNIKLNWRKKVRRWWLQ